MLRKTFTALLLSTCIIVASVQTPTASLMQNSITQLQGIDPALLSIDHIMEEIILDSKVENFTLYGLNGLAALTQGLDSDYSDVATTLYPYILFDLLDGNNIPEDVLKLPNFPKELDKDSVVQVFVFFAEAFGKENDPFYFYGVRPRIEGDVFKTTEEIQSILNAFRAEEAILRSKFSDILNIFSFDQLTDFQSTVFTSLSEYCKFFADFGQVYTQTIYGDMLLDGEDVEKNVPEAIRYFIMAAKKGDADTIKNLYLAQTIYGNMLLDGKGVEKNVPEAIRYFTMAAEKGDADTIENLSVALYNYGCMLLDGKGVEKNVLEAIHYFQMAAEKGDSHAIEKLALAQAIYGSMLIYGKGVERNLLEAIRYSQMAAENGNSSGERQLCIALMLYARHLLNGKGVEKNVPEAIRHFEMLVERSPHHINLLSNALNQYGVMLLNGEGVEKNVSEAIRYFERATEKGDADATNNLLIARSMLA